MSAEEQNKLVADYTMANDIAPRPDEWAGRCTIRLLTDYIMTNDIVPRPDEGIGNCAVRLLTEYQATIERYQEQPECADEDYLEQIGKYRNALTAIMNELGVPIGTYPQPVANAYEIAKRALGP